MLSNTVTCHLKFVSPVEAVSGSMSRREKSVTKPNQDSDLKSNPMSMEDKENMYYSSSDDMEEEDGEMNLVTIAKLFNDEQLGSEGLKPAPLSARSNIPKSSKIKPKPDVSWIGRRFKPISPLKRNFVDEAIEESDRIQEILESYPPPKIKREPSPAEEMMNFHPMVVGAEEVKALEDWVEEERINEPLSDIPEYNLLLDLAENSEKNYDVLLKILTPSSTFLPPKPAPVFAKPAEKPEKPKQHQRPAPPTGITEDAERPSTSKEAMKAFAKTGDVKKINPVPSELAKPTSSVARPVLPPVPLAVPPRVPPPVPLAVPPRVPPPVPLAVPPRVPPKPEDVTKMPGWLQACNYVVSKQVQFIEAINKNENARNQGQGASSSNLTPETATYAIIDEELLGYAKPQVKILSAKWFQQFGTGSMNNLRRSVVLTTVQAAKDHALSAKIRIIRQPSKREMISVDLKYTNIYCTLQLNTTLSLRNTARLLEAAVYKMGIDVIQQTFDTIRLAWIWSDGTVMIINGTTQAALVETQGKLMPKLMRSTAMFKAEPHHKLLYLRLVSHTTYPWAIDLKKFSQSEALCGPLFVERYVHYVTKDLPGVMARVHESGEVFAFAMDTALADKILARVYNVAFKYRVIVAQKDSAPN